MREYCLTGSLALKSGRSGRFSVERKTSMARAPPWRSLTRLPRREPGGGGIGQATYAAQSAISTRRRSNRSVRR